VILDSLLKIMPPPEHPVECGTWEDWAGVQSELGLRLPVDYKYFINSYGTGKISDFLYVLNPFSANAYLNLKQQIWLVLGGLRVTKQVSGSEEVPYPLYAEPGGLLPWGITDNGDTLYWLTRGENPDKWTVVIGDARGPEWEEYDQYMVEFLAKVLLGEAVSKIMGDNLCVDEKSGQVKFTPVEVEE